MPWVKEEWEWFGNNRTVNAGCPLPPSPWLYGAFDKGVPRQFAPLYEEHQLDIAKIQQFEREEMKQVESETPESWKEPYEEALSLYRKGELQGALQLIDNAVSVGLPKSKQAQALGGIGIKYVQEKRDVDSAFKCCTRSVELDPSAEWRAHSLLSMVYESEGDQVRAKQAYRDARRFAGTVWWEPDYERQLREIVSRWARNRE